MQARDVALKGDPVVVEELEPCRDVAPGLFGIGVQREGSAGQEEAAPVPGQGGDVVAFVVGLAGARDAGDLLDGFRADAEVAGGIRADVGERPAPRRGQALHGGNHLPHRVRLVRRRREDGDAVGPVRGVAERRRVLDQACGGTLRSDVEPAGGDVPDGLVLRGVVFPRRLVVVEHDERLGLAPGERGFGQVGGSDYDAAPFAVLEEVDLGVRDGVLDDEETRGAVGDPPV